MVLLLWWCKKWVLQVLLVLLVLLVLRYG